MEAVISQTKPFVNFDQTQTSHLSQDSSVTGLLTTNQFFAVKVNDDIRMVTIVRSKTATRSSRYPIFVKKIDQNSNVRTTFQKYSLDYFQLYNKAPWVSEFFQECSEINDVKTLLPYYKKINQLIVDGDFGTCNLFFRRLNTKSLSEVLLLGLLRLTSQWKNNIPAWKMHLDLVEKELKNRGMDSRSLLKGLF